MFMIGGKLRLGQMVSHIILLDVCNWVYGLRQVSLGWNHAQPKLRTKSGIYYFGLGEGRGRRNRANTKYNSFTESTFLILLF